ncbi:hypothetical protein SH449x_001963 [Pirellulaceae bacterium SH449]
MTIDRTEKSGIDDQGGADYDCNSANKHWSDKSRLGSRHHLRNIGFSLPPFLMHQHDARSRLSIFKNYHSRNLNVTILGPPKPVENAGDHV